MGEVVLGVRGVRFEAGLGRFGVVVVRVSEEAAMAVSVGLWVVRVSMASGVGDVVVVRVHRV